MIIDTTLSAMENRMDGFRRLDEAVERKNHQVREARTTMTAAKAAMLFNVDWSRSKQKYHVKEENKKFERRMEEMINKVMNFFNVGRNIQKSRELSE